MRIRQLESFVCVCELGSITQAAAVLNIVQPALGAQISALEQVLGVTLLNRGPRGTTITPAGQYFLNEAREILQRLAIAKKTVASFASAEQSELTIGLTPSLSALVAGPLAQELSHLGSSIKFRLVEDMSHILAARVAAGELDFALAFNIESQAGVTRTPLLREPMFFIAGPKSQFATPGPIDLAELAKAVFVIPTDKGQVIHLVKAAMDRHGLPLKIAFEIESMDAIKGLIGQGAACAVLPYGTVAREAEAGTLLARQIINPPLFRTLYVLQPSGRKHSVFYQSTLTIIGKHMALLADTGVFLPVDENEEHLASGTMPQ